MLNPIINKESNSSGTPQKQIVAYAPQAGIFLYQVPRGRKFVGYASSIAAATLAVNGITLQLLSNPTYAAGTPYPLTLIEGTFIVCTAGSFTLIGIESDA